MTDHPPIPPSPSEAEYRAAAVAPEPEALEGDDPAALFARWLEEARRSEPNDPNAMALATVDADGLPDVRMVLLKDLTDGGFGFFTNFESAKGRQLLAQPRAAICFHWKSLRRQVRARGPIEPIPDDEADRYFATRARDSQIGAWASAQSRPLSGPLELQARIAQRALEFGLAAPPRPPFWGGFRLRPVRIEFWRDRPFRLHDRLAFHRDAPQGPWRTERLYP